jgi:hypothetical protein
MSRMSFSADIPVITRKTEFLRSGAPGWLGLGLAVTRLGEHRSWAYYLSRRGRLVIQRDPETSLDLIPDNSECRSSTDRTRAGMNARRPA